MGFEIGLNRRIPGVVYGVVDDNKHPEGAYMVKVRLPWIRDTTAGDKANYVSSWCRVTSMMAGGGRGFYCLPEKDDEVLVAFVHGDLREGVVLGSLWNGKDKIPVGDDATGNKSKSDPLGNDIGMAAAAVDNNAAGGENNARMFLSRSGHGLFFDDTSGKESVQLFSMSGHMLVLNDEKDSVLLMNGNEEEYLLLDSSGGKITLETVNGDIDILCKNGTFNLEAKKITTKSTTTAEHEATNQMTDKSKKIVIEASSLVDIDGGKIELN